MASDVLITPSSGLIQFSSSAGSGSGQIKVDGDDLLISNVLGDVLLGDGASDVFIGDGTNNVDIVFEQNGEIRDDGSGKNIILGSKTTNLFLTGSTSVTLQEKNGNVGIGTTGADALLHISASLANQKYLLIENTAGTDIFVVTSSGDFGKVGIGTSAPQNPLSVSGSMTVFTNNNTSRITVGEADDSGVSSNNILAIEVDGANNKSHTFTVGTGHDYIIEALGNKGDVHLSPRRDIRFGINNGSAYNFTERMILTGSTGNLGIGTSTPPEKLTVAGNVSGSGTASFGHFIGNGSGLTGVTSTVDIDGFDAFSGVPHATQDEFLMSDNGTEKRATMTMVANGGFALVSGDATVAAGGALTNAAAQTNITSLLATDIKIGEDDQTKIDFETADEIHFYANNAQEMIIQANVVAPGADNGTALGDADQRWSDLFLASGGVINFNNGDATITGDGSNLDIVHNQGNFEGGMRLTTLGDIMFANVTDGDLNFGTDVKLFISQSSGNVGIGDNVLQPAEKLTVAGNVSGSGFLSIEGNVTASGRLTVGGVANFNGSFVNIGGGFGSTGVSIAADGDIQTNGTLTIDGAISASSDITASGVISASGGFVGDGSGLTGVTSTVDIDGFDAFSGVPHATQDEFLISDNGTEKRATMTMVANGGFALVSGDATIAAGGALTNAAAQTNINSILATDLILGEDAQTAVNFETADEIHFDVNNTELLNLTGAKISGSGVSTGSFGNLIASAIELPNDAISGDVVSGGTIGTTTITALAGALSLGDNNITNVGDINCDSISIDAASVGLNIAFGGNTTKNLINLTGNLADALNINEGGNSYIKFITTNNGEEILFSENTRFTNAITASGNISSSGTITANSFVGNLSSISNLIANDGANRVLTSDNDGTLSAESAIIIDGAAISIPAGVTINSNDDDIAFQIKGSSDANLFQANPQSNDKIGIGTNTPPEKLTVAGNISASGELNIDHRLFDTGSTTLNTVGGGMGDIVKFGGTTTIAGAIYQLKGPGTWEVTDADAAASATGSLAVALGTNATTNGMLLRGVVKLNHDPGGAVGAPLYLAVASGSSSNAAPTGNNDIARIIGYNFDASGMIYFNPDNTFVEVSA